MHRSGHASDATHSRVRTNRPHARGHQPPQRVPGGSIRAQRGPRPDRAPGRRRVTAHDRTNRARPIRRMMIIRLWLCRPAYNRKQPDAAFREIPSSRAEVLSMAIAAIEVPVHHENAARRRQAPPSRTGHVINETSEVRIPLRRSLRPAADRRWHLSGRLRGQPRTDLVHRTLLGGHELCEVVAEPRLLAGGRAHRLVSGDLADRARRSSRRSVPDAALVGPACKCCVPLRLLSSRRACGLGERHALVVHAGAAARARGTSFCAGLASRHWGTPSRAGISL